MTTAPGGAPPPAGFPGLRFPDGFLWGAATSAAQIEGGIDLDGRGPSIWDTFARRPDAIADGSAPTVADDHRRRMHDDVALMADLGLAAYRFSVAWPRVQPTGRGAVSSTGLDFYRELVDALLGSGIEPVVTLYHWDLPQGLQDDGGWVVRDTAARFADYAALVGDALGDRVGRWTTINEPWCAAMLGHAAGVHGPGLTDAGAAVAAAHHLLLAHGLAVEGLRSVLADRDLLEISISLNPYPVVPAGQRDLDLDAARRVDGVANRLWYDAVFEARYPADVLDDFSAVTDLSHIRDGDLAAIAAPIDAVGVNYYRRHHVRHRAGASAEPPLSTWPGSPDVETVPPPTPTTASGWAIEPAGLLDTLRDVHHRSGGLPVYVHENGAAFADRPDAGGEVDDIDRIHFLDGHLRAAHQAISEGVDLRGYFVWSLLDNFEWAEGYRRRFGIVHVDFETQQRTIKRSGRWFSQVSTDNSLMRSYPGVMAIDPVRAIRDIALGFPEATERETWGHPTFRVRDKIFVSYGVDDDGRTQLTMKAAPGEQTSLLAEGEPFFVPKYLGTKGWVGIHVDDETDWGAVAELVADSYREIAPRSLSVGIGLRPPGPSVSARAVVAVGNVIGELVEGKPAKDDVVAEAEADDTDDDGLKLEFDPDDPSGTSVQL